MKAVGLTICVVEDDHAYAEELLEFLRGHGMQPSWLSSFAGLPEQLSSQAPQILILDQFVNGEDALTLIPELRRIYSGGVIVLTGNQDVSDRIVALETGADDFVLKSLGPRELLARMRALFRRMQQLEAAPSMAPVDGKWRIDPDRHQLWSPGGTQVALTFTEFQALMILARRAYEIVSREEISIIALGRPYTAADRSVDNMLSRIRKAIEPHTPGMQVIRSVRGVGYMFTGFNLDESGSAGSKPAGPAPEDTCLPAAVPISLQ